MSKQNKHPTDHVRMDILTKLRDYLVANPEYPLEMWQYVDTKEWGTTPEKYKAEVACGTSTCLAGLIPHVAPEFADDFIYPDGNYNFNGMSESCVGNDDILWWWLFDQSWGNEVCYTIKRLNHITEGGSLDEWPTHEDDEGYIFTEWAIDQVVDGVSS